MDCCFDRTGFPYLELQDPALAVSLLPLTKLQFEYYLADLTPQGDNWYEELLNRIYFETHSFPLTVTLPFPPPSWGRARVGGNVGVRTNRRRFTTLHPHPNPPPSRGRESVAITTAPV